MPEKLLDFSADDEAIETPDFAQDDEPLAADKSESVTQAPKMGGEGTRNAPYTPKTWDDYNAIQPGEYYINPKDGQPRLKQAKESKTASK